MEFNHLTMLWMLPLAVILNLCLPYPRLPHPVEFLGRWLDLLEPRLRALAPKLERSEGFWPDVLCHGEVRAGFLGVLLTLGLTGAVARGLTVLPLAGTLCAIFLCYSGLALGPLLRAGRDALAALEAEDLQAARQKISMLVSRDVSKASPKDLHRALAESLAENFNDAFVAPLFWMAVGGPVGLWLYKAVSTMDSMWGYRTEKWENLGKFAARLDDVLAYVPARISAFLLWVTALAFPGATQEKTLKGPLSPGTGWWPGVATVRRQARTMSSPNAGWPMSSAAWLHGAPMGGPTVYHGKVVNKPLLGPDPADNTGAGLWNAARIDSLLHHLQYAGMAGAVMALICLWVMDFV